MGGSANFLSKMGRTNADILGRFSLGDEKKATINQDILGRFGLPEERKDTNEDILKNRFGMKQMPMNMPDPLSPLDKKSEKVDSNVFCRPNALNSLINKPSVGSNELTMLSKQKKKVMSLMGGGLRGLPI